MSTKTAPRKNKKPVRKPKKSMFGVLKGLRKKFKREELDRF
jgi:hypothetical protein